MDCPCDKCTKTDNPKACKRFCDDWKAWFVPRWERACLTVFRALQKQEDKNKNV